MLIRENTTLDEFLKILDFNTLDDVLDYIEYLRRVQEDHEILKGAIASLNHFAKRVY